MSFKKYIKAVGTGPKGNRDLEDSEITDAINMIIDRDASDSQIGAFLVAWRTKLEATSELKASVDTLEKRIKHKKIESSLMLGYSFDGRVKNPFLFPLYENILNEFYERNDEIEKLNLVIQGDFLQPAKSGLTTKDLFNDISNSKYLHFYDRAKYLKELSELTSLRHELGLRTAFNTVEKLLNPSQSEYGVTTAFHKPYVQKYLDIFSSHFKEIIVVKASEGSPEVFKNGKYWRKVDKDIKEFSFDLNKYDIKTPDEFEKISLDKAIQLISNPNENLIKLAKFNIALYLVFTNRVSTLDEAWDRIN